MKNGKERNNDQYWENILGFIVEDNDMLVNGVVMRKRKKGDKHDVGHMEEGRRVAVRMKDKLRITGMERLYIGIIKHKIFVNAF